MNITPQDASLRKHAKFILKDTRVDMTPMVDLGFLLITFFIFNTVLTKAKCMKLVMPADGKTTNFPASKSLTILPVGNNVVYWYEGIENENNLVRPSNFGPSAGGLRQAIMDKQKSLRQQFGNAGDLSVIIKPGPDCSYRELIAALDEMEINEVKKFAIAKQDEIDKKLIDRAK